MKSLEKLEDMIGSWLKPLPKLPVAASKWIATNAWLITLIGVILSAIGVLFMIFGIFAAIPLMSVTTSVFGYAIAATYTIWYVMSLIFSLIFMVITVIISAMAVTPLKAGQTKGWTLLFWILILRAIAIIVDAILSYSIMGFIGGIIWGAVGLAISAYILFSVRSYFIKREIKK